MPPYSKSHLEADITFNDDLTSANKILDYVSTI